MPGVGQQCEAVRAKPGEDFESGEGQRRDQRKLKNRTGSGCVMVVMAGQTAPLISGYDRMGLAKLMHKEARIEPSLASQRQL